MTSCGRVCAIVRSTARRIAQVGRGAIQEYRIGVRAGRAQHLPDLAARAEHQDFQSKHSAASSAAAPRPSDPAAA
jgi:hypothetical protein